MKTPYDRISVKNLSKLADSNIAVTIEYGDRVVELTKLDVVGKDDTTLKTDFDKKSKTAKQKTKKDKKQVIDTSVVLDDIFFHVNRNGRIVVATGEKPLVWPEDEVD